MTTRRPASLDSSLLARKGNAVPAVRQDSPLTEELGEPRPEATIVQFDQAATLAEHPASPAEPSVAETAPPQQTTRKRAIVVLLVLAALAALLFAALNYFPTADHATDSAAGMSEVATDVPSGITAAQPATDAASNPVDLVAVKPPVPTAGASDMMAGTDVETAGNAAKKEQATPPPSEEVPAAVPAPPVAAAKLVAPLPARKPENKNSSGASLPYILQLAAVPSLKAARGETVRLQKRIDRVLGQRKIVTVKAVGAGNRTVYRLRVAGYASIGAARTACKKIRQLKVKCLVIRR